MNYLKKNYEKKKAIDFFNNFYISYNIKVVSKLSKNNLLTNALRYLLT